MRQLFVWWRLKIRFQRSKQGRPAMPRAIFSLGLTCVHRVEVAPKTKAHIRNAFSLLFNCAMRWELIAFGPNPMSLVRVKNASKPVDEPRALSVEEFHHLLAQIGMEPVRVMVTVAMCLGLRVSELAALKWADIDWDALAVHVRRAIVDNRVDDVKTKYSRKSMPLDPALAEIVRKWQMATPFSAPTDWVFARPEQGGRLPYHPYHLQQDYIAPAALKAGLGEGVGWHTLRHSYSTMLAHLKVGVKVQQDLLRHADSSTTLNLYTHTVAEDLRKANIKVVRLVIPPKKRCSGTRQDGRPTVSHKRRQR